jgi:hypothetical protein
MFFGPLELPRKDVVDWSLTVTSIDAWRQRPSWLPGAGVLGSVLEIVQKKVGTTVDDLFHVLQGIRTGANQIFLQPSAVVDSLPKRERRYFKEAVDNASFVDGEIRPQSYLFVADPAWQTEDTLRQAVPQFFNDYLRREKESLLKRKWLPNDRWWELSRKRSWAFEGPPRLVSKRFGLYPAFARDLRVQYAIVQANAWTPTDKIGIRDSDVLREALTAYWWLLNSRIAAALLREYCPNVAGGQLDLEHKYVKHVPLPNLRIQLQENPALQVLASSIRTRNSGDSLPKLSDRDQFAAAAFGTDVSDWNLTGLELSD